MRIHRRAAPPLVVRGGPPLFRPTTAAKIGGDLRVYLKREDLTIRAHKIKHCIGQGLLARRMGSRAWWRDRRRPHGVATASVRRCSGSLHRLHGRGGHAAQALNVSGCVFWARSVGGTAGATLKEAISERCATG